MGKKNNEKLGRSQQHISSQIFVMNLDPEMPGLFGSIPVTLKSTIQSLDWPRRLYIQVSSFSEYRRFVLAFAELQHAPVLTPQEQRSQGTYPTRVYVHYISLFGGFKHGFYFPEYILFH